jgi:hypothetical protein
MANAPDHSPVLDKFVAQIGPLAQQLGITSFAFIGIDPTTKAQKFYGSPNAKAELRTIAGIKFGLGDQAETGWEG